MLLLRWNIIFGLVFLIFISLLQCSARVSEGDPVKQESGESSDPSSESSLGVNEVLVETIPVTAQTMRSYILLSSTIETETMVDIYPQVAGIIKELLVEEGDRVTKNSLLLQLDDTEHKLAEQKAEVNFRKSEADFNRVKESFEKKIISEVEYETAKFTMQEAELNWKQAQQDLSYTRITAPISGVVAERLVYAGNRVQNTTKLFQIVGTSEKIVRVFIPEKEISSVKTGQKTIVIAEFLSNREFQGTIKRISPVVDPSSGTFKVTVGISDPDGALSPGMFVSIRIITAVHENVIVVPKNAIVYDGGLPFVYVVKNSTAHKILLQEGVSDVQYVEALADLAEGDEIIIVGQSGLKDGTRVKVMQPLNAVKK
ncbi:hypothetical protein AMJ80_03440 [bacterium SM23_31]|nr:MAG: hypothetical protein AMJ80_03440 [bacterium SM23_31]